MIQAFVPVSQDNQQLRLVSFLTAKADRRNYGDLESFVMPQGQQINGPVQAALEINQDQVIASQFTLLDQQGSRIIRGTVQLIPVGSSIVYVQPIYVENEGSASFPVYQFVAVFAQDRGAVTASTVNEAIGQLFPEISGAPGTTPPTPAEPSTPTTPGGSDTVDGLLQQATDKFNEADAALRSGGASGISRYQDLIRQAQELVDRAQQLLNTGSAAAPLTSTTTTTRAAAAT
jgi:uncharacterized membrane protein (UPF0182 family)